MSLKDEHFVVTGTEKRGNRFIKVGKFYCLLNGKTYDTMYGLRNAIRVYGYTSKQYYDEFYKIVYRRSTNFSSTFNYVNQQPSPY